MDSKKLASRWYKLTPHPAQQALQRDRVRFKVAPCGRRSGKSECAKRHVVREAMRAPGKYAVCAPTRDQVRRIFWQDLKALSFAPLLPERPLEADLILRFPNTSEIHLVGLDQPARIEGVSWSGIVIDELASVKRDAWALNVRPALDTFDPSRGGELAWAMLVGTPEGVGNTFHELAEYARTSGDPDWKLYHWKSAEILPAAVIDAARRSLSAMQFAQEYEAEFAFATGRIYADYGDLNLTQEVASPHEQLLFAHDFNYTPMSSCIAVRRGPSFVVLDEIILRSATARMSALEFVERYKNHKNRNVIVYGDPAGRAGEKHGLASNYTEMEQVLRQGGWTVERRVRAAAPAIVDRHNAVRAMICNAAGERRLFVNPKTCPYVHKGLSTVSLKEGANGKPGSSFLEEPSDYQHVTTAVGYMVERECPVRPEQRKLEAVPKPLHHWPAAGQWGPRTR